MFKIIEGTVDIPIVIRDHSGILYTVLYDKSIIMQIE